MYTYPTSYVSSEPLAELSLAVGARRTGQELTQFMESIYLRIIWTEGRTMLSSLLTSARPNGVHCLVAASSRAPNITKGS